MIEQLIVAIGDKFWDWMSWVWKSLTVSFWAYLINNDFFLVCDIHLLSCHSRTCSKSGWNYISHAHSKMIKAFIFFSQSQIANLIIIPLISPFEPKWLFLCSQPINICFNDISSAFTYFERLSEHLKLLRNGLLISVGVYISSILELKK